MAPASKQCQKRVKFFDGPGAGTFRKGVQTSETLPLARGDFFLETNATRSTESNFKTTLVSSTRTGTALFPFGNALKRGPVQPGGQGTLCLPPQPTSRVLSPSSVRWGVPRPIEFPFLIESAIHQVVRTAQRGMAPSPTPRVHVGVHACCHGPCKWPR